jgi:hypothetical protein
MVYGVKIADRSSDYAFFDHSWILGSADFFCEYDWADFEKVADYVGMSLLDWHEMPTMRKIVDLFYYYGYENVFGSSYSSYSIKE